MLLKTSYLCNKTVSLGGGVPWDDCNSPSDPTIDLGVLLVISGFHTLSILTQIQFRLL